LKKFLTTDKFKSLVNENAEIVVLHGITSTARTVLFDSETKKQKNFMFNSVNGDLMYKNPAIKSYFMNFYNHDYEVDNLTNEMNFFNECYKAFGIKNLWFDTFNSHTYTDSIDNFIGQEYETGKHDMLSRMATLNGIADMDNNYHLSNWRVDTNRVKLLVETKHLNTFSAHPTKLGHKLLADIIGKDLEKTIQ
jgi:hypothetical protein